jgi:hypothetical protein
LCARIPQNKRKLVNSIMTEKLRILKHIPYVRSNFFGSGHESIKSYVYVRTDREQTKTFVIYRYIYLLTNVVSVSISGPLYSILNLKGENVQRSLSQKNRFDFSFSYLNTYTFHTRRQAFNCN